MIHSSKDEKLKAYKDRIIRPRNIFRLIFYLFPAIIYCVTLLFGDDYVFGVVLTWFIVWIMAGVRVMFFAICPWCHTYFFIKGERINGMLPLLYLKKCVNCGEPKTNK